MSEYDYDCANVVEEHQGLADVRLSGPVTLDVTLWDDGDFRVVAYHTIDSTYPFAAEAAGDEQGLPFYRERLVFETMSDQEGWTRHEVVRRRCGETGSEVIWSERVSGYTPDWPAPITDDDESKSSGFRYGYPGRFA